MSSCLAGVRTPPTLAKLLDALPPLAPRYYSIANAAAADPGRIHLCLSVVEFYANVPAAAGGPAGGEHKRERKLRHGLASSFIARVCAPLVGPPTSTLANSGSSRPQLPVFRREASGNELRLPADPSTPIVMVGPGTGLAPFRGFLQQRKVGWARSKLGDAHLFFGCRNESVDFLYASELKAMAASKALHLHTAFSRSGEPCAAGTWRGARINVAYVQDMIEENGAALCDVLYKRKGQLYVCGDGQAMATDVHAALIRATAQELSLSPEAAAMKLAELVKEGRYCREIWN